MSWLIISVFPWRLELLIAHVDVWASLEDLHQHAVTCEIRYQKQLQEVHTCVMFFSVHLTAPALSGSFLGIKINSLHCHHSAHGYATVLRKEMPFTGRMHALPWYMWSRETTYGVFSWEKDNSVLNSNLFIVTLHFYTIYCTKRQLAGLSVPFISCTFLWDSPVLMSWYQRVTREPWGEHSEHKMAPGPSVGCRNPTGPQVNSPAAFTKPAGCGPVPTHSKKGRALFARAAPRVFGGLFAASAALPAFPAQLGQGLGLITGSLMLAVPSQSTPCSHCWKGILGMLPPSLAEKHFWKANLQSASWGWREQSWWIIWAHTKCM